MVASAEGETPSSFADGPLRTEEIDSDDGFMRLQSAWNGLVSRIAGNIFLRHEWFQSAWAWRRTDSLLFIVCAWRGERLVGVWPLMRSLKRPGGRVLRFLSAPDTQWCDALVDSADGPAVGRRLVEHVIGRASQWDVLCLERLAAQSQLQRWLAPALADRGSPLRMEPAGCNLFVDLTSSWSDYKGSLSRSMKKARNLAANRLAQAGSPSVQQVTASTLGPERLQRCLDEVVLVSARSWKCTTGNSLDRPAPQAFLRALTQAACAQGWLSLWLLRLDDKAIAMEYQLVCEGQVYALRADFDDSYKELSPGAYLNYCMLEQMFGTGLKRYYMGPGKNVYKARWSTVGENVFTATGYAPSLRGRACSLWAGTKLRLRSIGSALPPGMTADKHTPG